jgi:hypothetical protein
MTHQEINDRLNKIEQVTIILAQQQELLANNQHQLVRMCLDLQTQIEMLKTLTKNEPIH